MVSPFRDRLRPIVVRGSTDAARELLDSLDAVELREAKTWFASSRRWFAELSPDDLAGSTPQARWEAWSQADWVVAMCAVRLCGPVGAARRVPWTRLSNDPQGHAEAALVRILREADRDWVAPFVDEAARGGAGGRSQAWSPVLSRVLRAVVLHHDLPCPSGSTFLAAWTAGTDLRLPLWERLSIDPLMPDLLFHFLASGHCGIEERTLPYTVWRLVEDGLLDRERIVEHTLAQLTAAQPPRSQRTLARIVEALDPRPEEIAGGLPFLLGVIATSEGSVGRLLLPLALELVKDRDGLVELTAVVGSRSEKYLKVALLSALNEPAVQDRLGPGAIVAALDVLAVDDDTAFAAKVDRRRAAVAAAGGLAPREEKEPAATGLWAMQPAPTGVRVRPRWMGDWLPDPTWASLLRRGCNRQEGRGWALPLVVDKTLTAMAEDAAFDGADLREAVYTLVGLDQLSVVTLTAGLNDLFLGGGLRQGWSTALAVADVACGAPRRPGGLAELLRLLATYAREVPGTYVLPCHIAALAGSEGNSKMHVEARTLGARLAGQDPGSFLTGLRQRLVVGGSRARGLWDMPPGDPGPYLLGKIRFDGPEELDLSDLRRMVEDKLSVRGDRCAATCLEPENDRLRGQSADLELTFPDRVLGHTVQAIHHRGADVVRAALRGSPRLGEPRDVFTAIDFWVAGRLDVPSYWQVVNRSVARADMSQRWHASQLVTLDVGLGSPGVEWVLLPWALSWPAGKLAFLRAAESLLLADRNPVTLSEPTYADGTLDLEDLERRLRASGGRPVGPLDLVQALYRLRPSTATHIDAPPVWTDPALTDPGGGQSWDATEVVGHWLAGGGLQGGDPVPGPDGTWSAPPAAPVPWSRCAAVAADFRDEPWFVGFRDDTIRMLPLWGDRAVDPRYPAYFDHFPSRMGGSFGPLLHSWMLMAVTSARARPQHVNSLLHALRHGRVDERLAVAAVVARCREGRFALDKLTQLLYARFEAGDLSDLWPLSLGIASTLCELDADPPGLPELLALLSAYANEVRAPDVPDELRAFAASPDHGESRALARELVTAFDRGYPGSTLNERPA